MKRRNPEVVARAFAAASACGLTPTIRGIANAAGLDPDTVSDLFRNARRPSARTVQKLAAALHTDSAGLAVILGGGAP